MSIEHLNKALNVNGLKPTEKFILVILANYADEKGSCYPSYNHIAEKIGLKTSKGVQKAIKKFETLGLLSIEHRYLTNGGNTSNRYHLHIGGGLKQPRVLNQPNLGSQETINTKTNTKNIYSESFQIFWKIYPRKINKKNAAKVFNKYDEKHYKKIIYGAEQFALQSKNTEEKYIPHASSWLNGERWLDYFETDETGWIIGIKESKINNLAG